MTEIVLDNVSKEILGELCPGRMRLRQNDFVFKNNKTNKSDHFLRDQITTASWVPRALGMGLRIKNNKDEIYKYEGFGDIDVEKINKFFKKNFDIEISKTDIFVKGFNWGDVEFDGNYLQMKNRDTVMFEMPLEHLYNASCQKDEIIMEINPNDDADICLTEMRFYVPTPEESTESRADLLFNEIKEKAGIMDNVGDSLVQFSELHCLQPRGRYDFKFYKTFIHMHGKSYDYKIPKASCMRMIVLPHPTDRKVFVTLHLQPPLKHGLTNYNFLIILCDNDSVFEAELNADDDFIKENFGQDSDANISGPEHEVLSKLIRSLYKIKITTPSSYKSSEGFNSISCTYKTSSGLLYPLERAFIFVPKPTPFIRFDEITSVQFVRGTYIAKSFDFTIQTRNGVEYNFSSIDKKDYDSIFNFITAKNIRIVKSDDKSQAKTTAQNEGWSSSDESHDAYLQKVKKEGKHAGGDDDSDESDDEDFAPPGEEHSEVSDEYDSNVSGSGSDDEKEEKGSSGDAEESEEEEAPKKSKPVAEKKAKVSSEDKPKKAKASKKDKDPNMPKKPSTAYIIWFNDMRPKIAKMLPAGAGIPEIGKKAGELWKTIDAEEKQKYLDKSQALKKEYDEKMAEYVAKNGPIPKVTTTKKSSAKKASPVKKAPSSGVKSQEFVENDDSSDISD